MVSLQFFGAIGAIGGNCIIVEEEGHRVMLDNGMNFGVDGLFYKDFLMARSGNGMRDLLALGIIHPVPGIYARSAINDSAIDKVDADARYMHENVLESYEDHVQNYGKPFIDAILISHAHVDHVRNLAFMAREIPVVMSDTTRDMLKVMKDVSNVDYLNFCTQRLATYSGGSFFPGEWKRETDCVDRNIIIVPRPEPVTFGPFTVHAHPIDHSIPGALAYEITTASGKSIVYTGDIRFHGVAQERQNALAFVEKMASKERVDAMISEGTRIQSTNRSSEETVLEKAVAFSNDKQYLKEKLIIASFPWKSVARFLTVYMIARKLGRSLVIQPKLAYLLHQLRGKPILMGTNVLKNEDIRIYQPRKLSMLYSDGDYLFLRCAISADVNWDKETKDYTLYRDVYGSSKHVRAPEISKNPAKFLLHMEFYELNELIDINPDGGACFSMRTEAIDDEGEGERKLLENWMKRFRLELVDIHASGHAPGTDIIDMIQRIHPGKVFPIHTEHPGAFKEKLPGDINVIDQIELGKYYDV